MVQDSSSAPQEIGVMVEPQPSQDIAAAPQATRRPDWDEYFMSIADAVKKRSPDAKQVGAVIVREQIILATGYNGFARGVQEHEWRSDEKVEKLRWAAHAEQNAIINAARVGVSVANARIYTTKFPCLKCVIAIVQAGITEIYTLDTKPYQDELIQDDGERVAQILIETNVRMISPNLQYRFVPQAARRPQHVNGNGR